MKKPWMTRAGDFFAGKGFYIALFLCVTAIGISGYYLFDSLTQPDELAEAGTAAQVTVTPSPAPTVPSLSEKPEVPPVTPTPVPVQPSPSNTPTSASTVTVSQVFAWPVRGSVLCDFSLEALAYDETMGDWRTHCGVDLAAAAGTQVLALTSGTVVQVYEDDLMGTCVRLEHGNGLESVYANLAPVPTVSAGDKVTAGAVLGSVGNTALAEIDHADHLHLEVYKNGLAVDPLLYLPE